MPYYQHVARDAGSQRVGILSLHGTLNLAPRINTRKSSRCEPLAIPFTPPSPPLGRIIHRNDRNPGTRFDDIRNRSKRVQTVSNDWRNEGKKKGNCCMTQAAQGAVRLEGDVITANGSILSGQVGNHGDTISLDDETSVCSCCCSGFQKKRRRPRFTVRRSPGKISHLLPMQQLPTLNVRSELRPPPLTPLLQLPPLHQHRASIWRPSTGVSSTFSQQQLPRRVSVWEALPLPPRNKKDGQISREDREESERRESFFDPLQRISILQGIAIAPIACLSILTIASNRTAMSLTFAKSENFFRFFFHSCCISRFVFV